MSSHIHPSGETQKDCLNELLTTIHHTEITDPYIHYRLTKTPLPARTSILISPPSNVFTGLWHFLRSRDIFAFNVAFAALLAKFTPILFSNIPFRNTVTWKMHEACTWLAVAVLSYMVLVLTASLFRLRKSKYQPHMPIKPDTIIGCMYYLVESTMLKDFEGLGGLGRKERDRLVSDMGKLYTFGGVEGIVEGVSEDSDTVRVGVDYFVPAGKSEEKGCVGSAD